MASIRREMANRLRRLLWPCPCRRLARRENRIAEISSTSPRIAVAAFSRGRRVVENRAPSSRGNQSPSKSASAERAEAIMCNGEHARALLAGENLVWQNFERAAGALAEKIKHRAQSGIRYREMRRTRPLTRSLLCAANNRGAHLFRKSLGT